MTTNIGRDDQDKSYRYKMPRLQTKVEGRGNGIKTVVPNMADIALALHCDPGYPTKFFGIELGAQSKYDAKRDVGIVNGKHDTHVLVELLNKFIDQFILCPVCKLPEINMDVKKSGLIKIDCRACGHNAPLKTAHKLVTYILNNPPSKKKAAADADKDADKETNGKKGKKGAQGSNGAGSGGADGAADDKSEDHKSDVTHEDAAVEEVAPPIAKTDAEVEWFTDTSEEAMEKRKAAEMEEMRASQKVDAILSAAKTGAGAGAETPAQLLRDYVAAGDRSVAEITSELRRMQLARGFDERERLNVMLGALVDTSKPKTVPAQFKKHANVIKSVTGDKAGAQLFLGQLEVLLGHTDPKCAPVLPHILQTLYEADALSEDAIVAWYQSPAEASPLENKKTARDLRKSAAPVVEWLQNAEEESDGEDDGDDEEDA